MDYELFKKEVKKTEEKIEKKFPYYSILLYFSFFLVVLFFMIILKPECVGRISSYQRCMSEEVYYLVFGPAIFIAVSFIITFVKKGFQK